MRGITLLLVISVFVLPLWSQDRVDRVHSVDPSAMYHRVYAIVPLIGAGTKDDPLRPMFVPQTSQMSRDHSGIIGYQMQISDDGKWALVEFVGATPKDLQQVTDSTDARVKVYERGKVSKNDIEAEFQKYKKNFTLDDMPALRVQ